MNGRTQALLSALIQDPTNMSVKKEACSHEDKDWERRKENRNVKTTLNARKQMDK